ncbi:MAG: hypothetical protein U0521_25635 [Anaerolineae bacterium]
MGIDRAGINRLRQPDAALELAVHALQHQRAAVFRRRLLDFTGNRQHAVEQVDIHRIGIHARQRRRHEVSIVGLMHVERQRASVAAAADVAPGFVKQTI